MTAATKGTSNTKIRILWLAGVFSIASLTVPNVRAADLDVSQKEDSLTTMPLALGGTELLAKTEDVQGVDGNPANMIDQKQYDQIGNYFLTQIAASPARRDQIWQPRFSSPAAYEDSIAKHREDLAMMLGLLELHPQKAEVMTLAEEQGARIEQITIGLEADFALRALLFIPAGAKYAPAVVAIPDADQSPEDFAGIREGMATALWLRELLATGVAVAIPRMVERRADHALCIKAGGHDRRRMLWRLGFLVGRSLVGMEVQEVTALADYLASDPAFDAKRIAVWGVGQGGMTALYSAAVDKRLLGATVQDYFQQREENWKEPVDRMLYGQLNEFGDAEVAALIAPRPLTILTHWDGPVRFASEQAEIKRARRFYQGLKAGDKLAAQEEASGTEEASAADAASMLGAVHRAPPLPIAFRVSPDRILEAGNSNFESLYRYAARLCAESDAVRTEHWKLASTVQQERPEKAATLRKELADLVGVIPDEGVPLHPRTRLVGETERFLVYEVLLDAVPGVEAYGQLLVPRRVAGYAERRLPAVVCQHGFGGAPKYISGVGVDVVFNDHFYQRFGERLAERGYVVFAPYLTVPNDPQTNLARQDGEVPTGGHRADLINPLVQQAASLGWMRTSIELAKLHRIVDFLQSLPFVDGQRIGYYGLSYGGYSATWMPPLEPRLKFTINSGFFNNWRQDITAEDTPDHYWALPDEDFYNWNVLNRFTHTELIAAMWPRPVCIEWGLQDPTTTPQWHQQAWQDVKAKYIEPWDMVDKVVDEDYVGVHTVHGIGTFFFVDRWLRPERSAGRDYGCDGEHYCNLDITADFHGYGPSVDAPYVTHILDSSTDTAIRGRFYVSDRSEKLTGMEVKASRTGSPGDLVIKLGSQEGASDIGVMRLKNTQVYAGQDLPYTLKLEHPVNVDPKKLYWFEVTSASGYAPHDGYLVYGPKPLGGEDYPHNFGLSFRMLTADEE